MKLSWKDIHLTNEYIYDERLTRHRGHGWDLSHLDNITETLLNRMPNLPNHDVYLFYGVVQSAHDSSRPGSCEHDQAPIIVAVSLPTGRVPTRTVGRMNNQTSQLSLISFDDLSYDWAPATDPSYGGRLFYLVCNADYSAVPDDENEARKHEYSSLFVVTPQDFATNAGGDYRVNYVNFSFLDEDGEEETLSRTRSDDPPLPDHLDQIVADHFEGVEEEERVRARGRIEQVS